MQLLILMLRDPEQFNAVVKGLDDLDIGEITVFDSESLGRFIGENVDDLSASMPLPVGERRSASKTIFGYLKDKTVFDKLKDNLMQQGIDFGEGGDATMMSLDISKRA